MVSMAASIFFSSIRKKKRKAKNRRKKPKKESNRHITEELLQEEILVRLPVKSLIRFKSVSKSWRSLIQSPSFIDFYRRRHCHDHSNHLLISPHSTTFNALLKKKSLSLTTDSIKMATSPSDLHLPVKTTRLKPPNPDEKWRRAVRVLGPLSNGIYCLVSYMHTNFTRISGIKIALCNPATRDYKFANSFPCDSRLLLTRLARQPCRVHYGFGSVHRCSFRVDYKVVVVISGDSRYDSFLCFVYSLRDGEWRRVIDYERSVRHFVKGEIVRGKMQYPEIVEDLELCPQRFFKRCWHWMALRHDGVYCVLLFDFADDEFGLMGGPPGYLEYNATGTIDVKGGVLVLNDHLAAVYLSHPVVLHAWQCVDIDVWMMMEYGVEESWTKVYAIKPDFYGRFMRLVGLSWMPVRDDSGGDGDGNCIERMLFEDDSKRLISCGDSGCNEHGVCDISSYICWNTLGVSTYMETLERLSC